MRILKLEAENVKRLRAVSITPDGALVVVSGKNGQGKSSVLDAIWMALGGKRAFPRRPVREGEAKATIRAVLEDLVITRSIRPDGETTLTVTSPDGKARYSSPQAMLDGLFQRATIDPLGFSRKTPGEQRDLLRQLVGVDTSAIDAERAKVYEDRTAVNREAKRLEGVLSSMPVADDGVPSAEVSIAALTDELTRADAQWHAVAQADAAITDRQRAVETGEGLLSDLTQRAEKLRAELAQVEERIATGRAKKIPALRQELEQAVAAAERARAAAPDREALRERLRTAEQTNARVREQLRRREVEAQQKAALERSHAFSARIDALDVRKREAIAGATYPLPGLALDDQGVLLNGVPLEQASSAEQLLASAAIGLALNPKLRVLAIRDGSLLDAEHLQALAGWAAEQGAQVWIERVATGEPVGIVIEDGALVQGAGSTVAEAAQPAAGEAP